MTRRDSTISLVAAVALVGILVAVLGLGTLLKGLGAILIALVALAAIALLFGIKRG